MINILVIDSNVEVYLLMLMNLMGGVFKFSLNYSVRICWKIQYSHKIKTTKKLIAFALKILRGNKDKKFVSELRKTISMRSYSNKTLWILLKSLFYFIFNLPNILPSFKCFVSNRIFYFKVVIPILNTLVVAFYITGKMLTTWN